jgi:ethanolamine utilization protein EutQ
VERYGAADVPEWFRQRGVEMAIGDVVEAVHGGAMSVGFMRYAAGAENRWTLTYDEALVITKGRFTVDSDAGPRTAAVGEVIFLRAGTSVVYRAEEDSEAVYVTHPHWHEATLRSELAAQLDGYEPVP